MVTHGKVLLSSVPRISYITNKWLKKSLISQIFNGTVLVEISADGLTDYVLRSPGAPGLPSKRLCPWQEARKSMCTFNEHLCLCPSHCNNHKKAART